MVLAACSRWRNASSRTMARQSASSALSRGRSVALFAPSIRFSTRLNCSTAVWLVVEILATVDVSILIMVVNSLLWTCKYRFV